jgi:hypothetical protein
MPAGRPNIPGAPAAGHSIQQGRLRALATRQRVSGFTVVVDDRVSGQTWDLTAAAAGLRYTSRLPGGFADCTFTMTSSDPQLRRALRPLHRVRVYFRGSLAWEGRIEEPPMTQQDADGIPVLALGYGADLKHIKFTKLYVTRGYGGFRPATDYNGNNPAGTVITFSSPRFEPGSNTTVGAYFVHPDGAVAAATDDSSPAIWAAPPGCSILRVKGTWRASGNANNGGELRTVDSVPTYQAAVGDAVVVGRSWSAGNTTFDTTCASPRQFLLFGGGDLGGASTAAGDDYCGLTDLQIVGARTVDGAVFDPAQVTTFAVLRSMLAEFGGGAVQSSPERMYSSMYAESADWLPRGASTTSLFPWDSLVFDSPTTVEAAIGKLNEPVGWEWGVFEDGLFYYGPMEYITSIAAGVRQVDGARPGAAPVWVVHLRQSDGHRAGLTESLAGVVNEVTVTYTTPGGVSKQLTSTDYTNPANPLNGLSGPLQRRGEVVSGGTLTDSEAAEVAAAYLSQFARPQVKGDIQLNTIDLPMQVNGPGTKTVPMSPAGNRVFPGPLLRPGHWVMLPDADTGDELAGVNRVVAVTDVTSVSGGYTSGPMQVQRRPLPIRQVSVDADKGSVTVTVDSTQDRFGPLLARLAQGRA